MPIRVASSRAFSRSGSGNRKAIWTLAVRFNRATRREPFTALRCGSIALQVLADMIESGEEVPPPLKVLFAA